MNVEEEKRILNKNKGEKIKQHKACPLAYL
jgi:hypothetical protein